MKVFISWSGTRSKAVANALRDWLPMTLSYVKPWVSDKDIGAGDRWAQSIAGELESSNFGIICITPENLQSEWILFEAGALSKSMLDAKVIPLLFGLELSDLSGPLSQFQAQKVEMEGLMEVVRAINKVADGAVNDAIVSRSVPALWPTLQTELDKIPSTQPEEKHMRPQHEILEELVSGVRGLNARMRDFNPEMLDSERYPKRRRMRLHPRMFNEMFIASRESGDSPTGLLMIAGYLREDFPWLAELFTESYREIRAGGPDTVEIVLHRLQRSFKHMRHLGMMTESKEAMMIMEELPMLLEITLHHMIERNAGMSPDKEDSDNN
ncbi:MULTISPECIES: toll/interleukin-1 receptor domain-containing protein [unclassified Pannonibacter]|uniref:toll/interleukin-1 receptor domain-containing protein n=1 Tax=unclassified Pannonibacter TaxID=2627228 RepID=UPI0016440452|nr:MULTISPECIES: toll/interleukin-1 receptor domain-containing protein [unclassified Pannonibacter]